MIKTFTVIRETLLTRAPRSEGIIVSAVSTFLLFLGSVLYWDNFHQMFEKMPAWQEAVFENKEYYRLWTTLFAHADMGHLLSNSLMFFILGAFLAGYFGTFVFPITAFLAGGLTNLIALQSYGPKTQLIGASGVVFWMGGAWLTLYFLVNRQKSVLSRWLRCLGVALALFMPAETFDPQISYRTHFIGFVLGVIWAALYFVFKKQVLRNAELTETIVEATEDIHALPM